MRDPSATPSGDGLLVRSALLSALPWLCHGSTTVRFSAAVGADKEEQLTALAGVLGDGWRVVVNAQQRHTARVGTFGADALARQGTNRRFEFPATDAIVCPLAGLLIAVATADCVPILIADRRRRAIAAVHAGWRGTLERIVEGAVAEMARCGAAPGDLVAWVGPCISGARYEVSSELADSFGAAFPDAHEASVPFLAGRMLDLAALNAHQLRRVGIPSESIEISGLCTFDMSDKFPSYRRDGEKAGRVLTAIGMLP